MKIYLTCVPPCEEIAAEAGTAQVLTQSLHGALAERFSAYLQLAPDATTHGFPVVTDPALKPGVVQLRPRRAS